MQERLLQRGSQGPDVRDYQQILKGMGAYVGQIDGIFGPLTEAAVRAFQQAKGLHGMPFLKVDGIIGPNTEEAVLRIMDGKNLLPGVRGALDPARPSNEAITIEDGKGPLSTSSTTFYELALAAYAAGGLAIYYLFFSE